MKYLRDWCLGLPLLAVLAVVLVIVAVVYGPVSAWRNFTAFEKDGH